MGREECPDEFEVEEVSEKLKSSRASRFNLLSVQLGLDRDRRFSSSQYVLKGLRGCTGFVIRPDNRWYQAWAWFILLWAVYCSFFTPFEFGFFRGLPEPLSCVNIATQAVFLVDIFLQFFVAYKDAQTYRMVYKRRAIAIRYLKSGFLVDILGCVPWDAVYKASGRREEVRYLVWLRLSRVCKVTNFFHKLEKDIRINYLFTRIVKLIVVELYCTHTAACIFYYLATTLPASQESYTWIGSLKLGSFSYENFREIDLTKRYVTSLYFAIVTMATVGYGDIHAVNTREMVFIMIFVSFDMILGAYLIGNMTALIVKGSKTERFRDKMKDLIKYMNRNKLGKEIRHQIKGHVRLRYERSYTEADVLQDIPVSIRAKISQNLYSSVIENVPLFKGCSSEFVNQIVTRLHEEFFLPGEVIMEQGNAIDQLYFVCHGMLEEVGIGEDGLEETILQLEPNCSFGEVAILCNIPQPYTVRVCELCRLLRLDKQSFTNILQVYFVDGRTILNNLLQVKESNIRLKKLETDITFHIEKKEAEIALRLNSSAFHGDLYQLKHLAASKGYDDVTSLLIQEGVDINLKDNFGNTPLLEAIKYGHDRVASLLLENGASLNIDDAGSFLCQAVARGNSDFIRRLLTYGVDPNAKDYDYRTPLHIAAAQGQNLLVKILLEAGADVLLKDRQLQLPKIAQALLEQLLDLGNLFIDCLFSWISKFPTSHAYARGLDDGENTPIDEAHRSGSKQIVKLLEVAKGSQLSQFPDSSKEVQDKHWRKKCTVLPFHPWAPKDKRREGIVMWIPDTLGELIESASEKLNLPASGLLSEDAGKILELDMISDGQRLYLVNNGANEPWRS